MPFISSSTISQHQPVFHVFRAVSAHAGTSSVIKKMAKKLKQQGKRVLIFDAALGLKNFPIANKNQNKIPLVFQGQLPLNDLIVTQEQVDIIAGSAGQNLNALPRVAQNKIKDDLITLSTSYDDILIDWPACVIDSVCDGLGSTIWVSTPDKKILLKTLKTIDPHTNSQLVLTQIKNTQQRNDLHLFIKSLVPECKIIEFFE